MEIDVKEVVALEYVIRLDEAEVIYLKSVLKANLDIPFAAKLLEELVKEGGQ